MDVSLENLKILPKSVSSMKPFAKNGSFAYIKITQDISTEAIEFLNTFIKVSVNSWKILLNQIKINENFWGKFSPIDRTKNGRQLLLTMTMRKKNVIYN